MSPNSTALLASLPMAPSDPILGITEAYARDTNPRKVNLGQGLYYGEDGAIPLLECVRRAEARRMETSPHRGYLPIDGLAAYDQAVQALVFGERSERTVTVQTVGGTGALKVGADFIRRLAPGGEAWISEPSWENHRQLFEAAGFAVRPYAYYDPRTRDVDFEGMRRSLNAIPAGSVVVLHGCCHNPTGADLDKAQWAAVLDIVQSRGLVPFLDLAYQGFADGVEEDAYPARLFAAAMAPVFVASSFSKSFSLYGERVGALSVVTGSGEEAARVLSNLKAVVRTNYSNPPTHGGQVVATILQDPALKALWIGELGAMRERIKAMRRALVESIERRARGARFDFVLKQRGMFSYTGLTKAQVERLRREFSIYLIETGRICVPALNPRNLDYVADAIAKVLP